MKKRLLSIIITHYKTPHLLMGCLDAIKENLKTLNYEVFVSDSEANRGTAFLLKHHHPKVNHLAFRKNVGYAKLVNAGLEKSKGDFVLILNADTIIEEEKTIMLLMSYLDKNKEVGLVGPKLINIDGSLQKSYFKDYTFGAVLARRTIWKKTPWGKRSLEKFEIKKESPNHAFSVDWLMGSALMTRKDCIKKVGPMDERYFMYFEDVDWCRRFREKGYEVKYLPKAQLRHFHFKSSDSKRGLLDVLTNKLTRTHIFSYIKYLLKWRGKNS